MTFGTFEEAERFIAARPSEHWRIASADPLTSCVPLEALTDYTPAFRSLGRQSTSKAARGLPRCRSASMPRRREATELTFGGNARPGGDPVISAGSHRQRQWSE